MISLLRRRPRRLLLSYVALGAHAGQQLELVEMFAVERSGERERYQAKLVRCWLAR